MHIGEFVNVMTSKNNLRLWNCYREFSSSLC